VEAVPVTVKASSLESMMMTVSAPMSLTAKKRPVWSRADWWAWAVCWFGCGPRGRVHSVFLRGTGAFEEMSKTSMRLKE
jgi:hypothetical protein